MFEQLGLIGCGLMGGSFALALKRAGLVKRIVGYSKSPTTTERARQNQRHHAEPGIRKEKKCKDGSKKGTK